MKILTAAQIREADRFTIENEPIASVDLMERAATNAFERIRSWLPATTPVKVFCGVGNNGGDGLVIARKLQQADYPVETWLVRFSDRESEDLILQYHRLKTSDGSVHELGSAAQIPSFDTDEVIIDAIFGTGLSREAGGFVAELIDRINESNCRIISIDMPSGLMAENNVDVHKRSIVKAGRTLTFEVAKLAFLLPQNAPFTGEWEVVPIGLNPTFIRQQPSDYQLVTEEMIRSFLKNRPRFSHKGHYGKALLMVGSKGKIGAGILAAKACLRSGAGLLTTHIPACGYTAMQTAVPEAMCLTDQKTDHLSATFTENYTATGIGPGIGLEQDTANALKFTIQNSNHPIVLDADALNLLAMHKTWLAYLPQGSILTPHPGEFERLAGKTSNDYDRLQMLKDLARKSRSYVVLKGAHTAVAFPDGRVFFNDTGNPGMATGGSGDVLTGILTGLVAQGYRSDQAVLLGVWLHGLAGDIAVSEKGEEALIAGDIVEALPKAWKYLRKRKNQE